MHGATAATRRALASSARNADGASSDPEGKENEDRSLALKIFSPVLNFLGADDDGDDDGVGQPPSQYDDGADMKDCSSAHGRLPPGPASQAAEDDGAGGGGGEEQSDEDDEDDEDLEEFNPYLFIKQLPPYSTVRIPGKVCLPPKTSPHPTTLVLDLDETLVHCTVEPVPDPDMVFPVVFGGVSYQVHVRLRPGVEEFLKSVSGVFEVVVFTASQKVYADSLLDRLDPTGTYIQHRLFRDSCLPVEGNYLKDLTVLNRPLSHCVLVDNSPHAFGYQTDNGIPIESWFDDPKDRELGKLTRFLQKIVQCEDVRPIVRKEFETHRLIEEA